MGRRVILFVVAIVIVTGAAGVFALSGDFEPTAAGPPPPDATMVTIESFGPIGEEEDYELVRVIDRSFGHECYVVLDRLTGDNPGGWEAAPAIDCPS